MLLSIGRWRLWRLFTEVTDSRVLILLMWREYSGCSKTFLLPRGGSESFLSGTQSDTWRASNKARDTVRSAAFCTNMG
jgi:hypothetical protein